MFSQGSIRAERSFPQGARGDGYWLVAKGSGDIATLAQANCFLVIPADRDKLEAGETVSVLLRKDVA